MRDQKASDDRVKIERIMRVEQHLATELFNCRTVQKFKQLQEEEEEENRREGRRRSRPDAFQDKDSRVDTNHCKHIRLFFVSPNYLQGL